MAPAAAFYRALGEHRRDDGGGEQDLNQCQYTESGGRAEEEDRQHEPDSGVLEEVPTPPPEVAFAAAAFNRVRMFGDRGLHGRAP